MSWDRAARAYGRQEPLELRAVRRALELAVPRPADVVLDVATGTGLVLRELARRPDRPRRATGLDASAPMLARVGPLPPSWRTGRADARALPHPDASADLAFASYLLHVLAPGERAQVLCELRRVVRPGGRLVLVTPWSPRAPVRALLDALARPETLRGLRTHDPRPELAAAGWAVRRAAVLHRGYPSLVVLAT